ncbi:hypothetical protein [Sphingopyxis sp.]|uniref:hypothetical protein n=1 Tax=Sphingopyxis sp. TaxID=1908224 RepID=UPI002D779CB4|nr:hypothetical protein [Sphingopyxis sp.]HET6525607.1 hypothetical protein [Sphingopyxis sp.]
MRALLISSALAAAFALSAAAAAPTSLLPVAPEAPAPAAALAPLAKESVWTPRFEAAAGELADALRSGDEARWGPLLGGKWLAAADRERIKRLLGDRDSPFRHALLSKGFRHRAILGWDASASMSAADRAAIEAGQEAEALVCWSAGGSGEGVWPTTAREADNRPGRPYACARIAYSIRGDAPTWRAFIERHEPA